MTPEQEQLLIEQAAGAWRPAADHELHYHKAWHDLDAEARVRAFDRAAALRPVEAAAHPEGLSTTALAVLAKIQRRG